MVKLALVMQLPNCNSMEILKTVNTDIKYTELYRNRQNIHAYPNEFAIRTFLGAYPTLPPALRAPQGYKGKFILDLGCGDGRNMPLFHNCGMNISGTEVTEDACTAAINRMKLLDIKCNVLVGRSNSLPFPEGIFDFIFSSGVSSFVDEGDTFQDNLAEPARVLKDDGLFIFYLLNSNSSQVLSSENLGGGYYRISNDPFGRINGSIVRAFSDRQEIERELSKLYTIESFGASHVKVYDFFSISAWWLICSKRP